MTTIDGQDDAGPAADGPEPAPTPMRFTVMDRRDDRVHLVCEDDEALYGHPSVYEEVWQAALTEVPPNWEIVDLSPPVPASTEPTAEHEFEPTAETARHLNEFAARKYELFLAFLGAGFGRSEALTLVIETLNGVDD
jgi:hypothetical protein